MPADVWSYFESLWLDAIPPQDYPETSDVLTDTPLGSPAGQRCKALIDAARKRKITPATVDKLYQACEKIAGR